MRFSHAVSMLTALAGLAATKAHAQCLANHPPNCTTICEYHADPNAPYCQDLPFAGVSCGNETTISVEFNASVGFSVGCVELSGGVSISQSFSLTSGECQTCYATVCFPNAWGREEQCTRRGTPCEWRFVWNRRLCEGYEVPVKWYPETYTREVGGIGAPVVSKRCVETPGLCGCNQLQGGKHPNQGLGGASSRSHAEADSLLGLPGMAKADYETFVRFTAVELAQSETAEIASRLTSLGAMSLRHTNTLISLLDEAVEAESLDMMNTEVIVELADGAKARGSFEEIFSKLSAQAQHLEATRADINRDGIVDESDMLERIIGVEQARMQGVYNSYLDSNLDGLLSPIDSQTCNELEIIGGGGIAIW